MLVFINQFISGRATKEALNKISAGDMYPGDY